MRFPRTQLKEQIFTLNFLGAREMLIHFWDNYVINAYDRCCPHPQHSIYGYSFHRLYDYNITITQFTKLTHFQFMNEGL